MLNSGSEIKQQDAFVTSKNGENVDVKQHKAERYYFFGKMEAPHGC